MIYFITGATGFVGRYLVRHLLTNKNNIQIIGTYRNEKKFKNNRKRYILERVDLNDNNTLASVIKKYRPDIVIHLAAESSVSYSWNNPTHSFTNNLNIYLNLLEVIRVSGIKCRLLSVGSSESYGIFDEKYLPLLENTPLNPVSPYAVARVSQELISKVYVQGYGMDIVLTRSFNHFGKGQDERFVVPSLVSQLIGRKKARSRLQIQTGDLSIVRDFVDVRDVVKAYMKLLEYGKSGEVYNVSSGIGISLREIFGKIQALINYEVGYSINPEFIRPTDNPIIVGNSYKIKEKTGWTPIITLDRSLQDIVNYIEKQYTQSI